MNSSAPFKQFLNNFWFVSSLAIGAIYVTKTIIENKREKSFHPEHFDNGDNKVSVQDNIAKIKPGFAESTGEYKRKSEYEGAGNSYSSRKGGDKFSGILDFGGAPKT
ncbi:hypothetical protein WICANDRAFT_76477 [Wickerhamomyces anomalus NRRL Y-366-8]|uniref:Uncharacterized protein n=1 Tax=Wickerhamomyces anomalus (strain ATCC 58044 / CBS 1984 / NCYC 433 / NRRL Y-366-8) TaxID=683960 RepID=A0A1E3PAA3_WICAA|nr:uncharacterized protein WICANDRAFT_76477 [Wickerhamomyces anomalus NRRL Y-366-8]ODQ62298.1 hypothetical protein WICANDRAFT_76477 [Wickerhamomyces anomalus NRRL Y-366-8]